jgi:hypothetical protein
MSKQTKHTGLKRLVLDANLLILWVTGLYRREDVGKTKSTRSYGPEQFDQLDSILSEYVKNDLRQIVVTPNVVTECSDLVDDSRPKNGKSPRGQMLKKLIDDGLIAVEEYVASKDAMQLDEYRFHGVTDCTLLHLIDDRTALFTDDTDLAYRAMAINPDSQCFGRIREDIHGRNR